jgi:tetratricopeptide (TPR) repeat protein
MRSAVLVMILLCAECAIGSAQVDSGAQLTSRIQAAEQSVSSASGRMDGMAWLQLATLYEDRAQYDKAERAFRKATDLLKPVGGARYADALDAMGVMYIERGKFAKAEALELDALAIRQKRDDRLGIGRSYMHLALVAYGKRDMRCAETDAEMAVSLLAPEHKPETRTISATPEEKMSALIDIALIRCANGACEKATHDVERALRLAVANYPSNSVPVGFLHFLLGYTRGKSSDVVDGLPLMKMGVEEMKAQMGWGHPTYIAALREYRAALVRAGRGREASELEENLAKLGGSSGSVHPTEGAGLLGLNAPR